MSARVIVIGLGRIGRLHARNLAGAGLAGVVDAVEETAREVGEAYGVPWSASPDEMLPHADAAVIAAPTGLHAELVEQCVAAGVHVLCEKPLGFTPEEAERATSAARAAGVLLWVGFQRRFDPDWRALARASVGRPQLLRVSHRNARAPVAVAELGDLFVDVAIHDLDAARWLIGEVAEVFARERSGAATIWLRFESGAFGLIDVSRSAAYGFECSAELVGTRATARVDGAAGGVSLLCDGQIRTPLAADHAERHAEAYRSEVRQFVAAVGGAAVAPAAATGEDAVAALRLAHAARRSAATGAPVLVATAVAA